MPFRLRALYAKKLQRIAPWFDLDAFRLKAIVVVREIAQQRFPRQVQQVDEYEAGERPALPYEIYYWRPIIDLMAKEADEHSVLGDADMRGDFRDIVWACLFDQIPWERVE